VPKPDERQTAGETGGDPPAVRRPATLQEARALAHPLRLRILRLCLDQALTNGELATSLGQRPATVLHHVRTLLATGFLAEEAHRPGPRGTTEKPYRATGKSWRLDVGETGEAGALHRAMFGAVAAEIDEAGPGAVIESSRMAMRLRPDQLDELLGRLRDLIDEYRSADEYLTADASEGDPYAMLVVLHRRQPARTSTESDLPRRAGPGRRAADGAPSS
jgi:predicted ArsR family transcriptional regulator